MKLRLLLAISTITASTTITNYAQSYPDFPHILTSGSAVKLVENDTAQITASVRSISDTAVTAQQMAAEAINKVTEVAKEDADIEKLQTIGVQTNPIYTNPTRSKPQISGYESSASLQITTNAKSAKLLYAKLGELQTIWNNTNTSATLSGPHFLLSPTKAEETEKALIKDAYDSALAQATALASAAGLKLGQAVKLTTAQAYSAPTRAMAQDVGRAGGAMMMSEAISPIETQSGESQISRSVEVVFSVQ